MLPHPDRRPRVVLADDHVLMREGLESILEQEGFEIVGVASDGRAATKVCEVLQPDVAILDVAMPALNGIDAGRDIMRLCPNTKVVLLTMYKEEGYVLAGLRAGIAGYVLKSSAASNLVQAIDAVLNGEVYLSPGVSRTLVQAYLATAAAPPDPLSLGEREVLQLLAEGAGTAEIATQLGITEETAEAHRAHIMAKLDIPNLAGLVRYAITHRLVDVQAELPSPDLAANPPAPVPRGIAGRSVRSASRAPSAVIPVPLLDTWLDHGSES
jgi:two-component system, NarL family, response regulator NreC